MNVRTAVMAAFAGASIASSAAANVLIYNVNLDGATENPPNGSPGFGTGTVTVDTTANTMQVNFSFSGLLGTTTACHIHAATATAFTGNAGVATTTPFFAGFPLGVTAGSYNNTLDMTLTSSYNPSYVTANGGTTASAEAALFSAIAAGKAYLNVHTTVVSGGEIRGFLVLAPTPGAFGVAGLGGLALLRRRR